MKSKILFCLSLVVFLQLMFSVVYAQGIGKDDISNNRLLSENVQIISGTLDDNIRYISDAYLNDSSSYPYLVYVDNTSPDSTVYVYNNDNQYISGSPDSLTDESLRIVDYSVNNDTLNVDKFTYSENGSSLYGDGTLEKYRINYNSGYTNPVLEVIYVNDNKNELETLQYNNYGNSRGYTTYSYNGNYQNSEVILIDPVFSDVTNVSNDFSDVYDNFRQNNVNGDYPITLTEFNEYYEDNEFLNSNIGYSYYIDGQIHK
jgi:hypothetical protein